MMNCVHTISTKYGRKINIKKITKISKEEETVVRKNIKGKETEQVKEIISVECVHARCKMPQRNQNMSSFGTTHFQMKRVIEKKLRP